MSTRRVVAGLACVAALAAFGGCQTTTSRAATVRPTEYRLTSAERAVLSRAVAAARVTGQRLAVAGQLPSCKEPTAPQATYPTAKRAEPYGIPFVAAITGGSLLSGYSEYTASHPEDQVGTAPYGHTYDLSPWASAATNITGWVTGLLELPSLDASVPATTAPGTPYTGTVTFCTTASKACLTNAPPKTCSLFGLSGETLPGTPPAPPTGSLGLITPSVATGPSSLAPGATGTYTFTVGAQGQHFGTTLNFGGSTAAGKVSGVGTAYYVGYPYDFEQGQGLELSNIMLGNTPTDLASAGSVPGVHLTSKTFYGTVTITNVSPQKLSMAASNEQIWIQGTKTDYPAKDKYLAAGASVTVPFTGSTGSGAGAVMLWPQMGGPQIGAAQSTYSGFGVGYYYKGSQPGLSVSGVEVNGQTAGSAPGPDTGTGYYAPTTVTATVTNNTGTMVTGITGATPAFSCTESPACLSYVFSVKAAGTTTLSVTGVVSSGPDKGALEAIGTSGAQATVKFYASPVLTLSTSQHSPTVASISTQPAEPTGNGIPDPLPSLPATTPLSGPLVGTSGTLGGDDFTVPGFYSDNKFSAGFAIDLNEEIGGFNSQDPATCSACQNDPTGAAVTVPEGWTELSATTQIVSIGLPEGVPPEFNF
jgi:hypothetical protein